MSTYESFDDFYSTERVSDYPEQPPFQFREDTTEKGTLEWLVANYDGLEQAAHSRLITYRRYLALYKGIQWRYYDVRDTRRDEDYTQRKPRHVVNFIHEMTEARVAQNARLKANVSAIPNNDEQDDFNNAKLCKKLLDARAYDLGINQIFQENDRNTFNFGHGFLKIVWDKEIGPIHPLYKDLAAKGEKVPYLNKETGKPVKGKYVQDIKVGDVTCLPMGPDRVYPQIGVNRWGDVLHVDELDWIHKEELKARYPKKANDIEDNDRQMYDFSTTELTRPKDKVMVRTFWHKPTKFLPKGCKITYTDSVILEKEDFPFEHGELPFIPQTDIDVYGELWGRSYITNVEQMQRMYNNIQSGIARDFGIGAAPKWVMPKGAVDIHSINNEFTVMEYTGAVPPQMVTNNPTTSGNYEIQDRLEAKISQLSAVYDISRGEVPSGVTANSALRFLDEQESQRIIVQEQKRKQTVLDAYKMMLSVMKQFYKPSDDRTVRTLGKGNEYLIESMKKADFSKIYDVQLQNTSSLPDTKTGKIAAIIDLNIATQTDPIFRKEEIVEMLDLGTDEYFKDKATIAVNAARTNLQYLLEGTKEVEPKVWEDLMVHYSIFTKALQETSFKTKSSPEAQKRVVIYITVLEGLMFERAKKNFKFLSEMQELEEYPMFFQPEMPVSTLFAMKQQEMAQLAQPMMPEQGGPEFGATPAMSQQVSQAAAEEGE